MKMMAEVSATQRSDEGIVSLGTRNGIELAILKRTEKSLGKIIAKPDSTDLIDGIGIEPLQIYPDDRGFFTELARLGRGLAADMVPDGARFRFPLRSLIPIRLRRSTTIQSKPICGPP
jgi:hypothetical protein